jgi:hypothetical protein
MDEFEKREQDLNEPYPAPEASREEPSGYGQSPSAHAQSAQPGSPQERPGYGQSPPAYSQSAQPGGAPYHQTQRPDGPYAQQSPPGGPYGGAYGQQTYPQQNGQGYPGGSGGPYSQRPYSAYYREPQVPPEVKKWNWGAFALNWIWGCGNGAYLALICLIPVFGWFIWPFVCGARGNIWAWKSGKFKDLDTFLTAQRTWNTAGFVFFWVYVALIILEVIVIALNIALLAPFGGFGDTGFSEFEYNAWD